MHASFFVVLQLIILIISTASAYKLFPARQKRDEKRKDDEVVAVRLAKGWDLPNGGIYRQRGERHLDVGDLFDEESEEEKEDAKASLMGAANEETVQQRVEMSAIRQEKVQRRQARSQQGKDKRKGKGGLQSGALAVGVDDSARGRVEREELRRAAQRERMEKMAAVKESGNGDGAMGV